MTTDEVLFHHEGALGRIVLNRPRAINALTIPMVVAIDEQLQQWANDDAVQVVSIEGAGERGLCAGGDVVAVRQAVLDGGDHTEFFAREYEMNARIAHYAKPIVAWQDGIVFGGGVGISAHAKVRLVSERTKVAMPETIIGFFPDVGALSVLTKSPGEIGKHLSLTGTTIGGVESIYAGISDGHIGSDNWDEILDAMREGNVPVVGPGAPENRLEDERSWIDECYEGFDAPVILERLRTNANPQAREAAELLSVRSPLAVCATLEAFRRAESMTTVDEVLRQDLVLASNMATTHDFLEGVRAQIVDKDRNPKWSAATVADVTRAEVEELFVPRG